MENECELWERLFDERVAKAREYYLEVNVEVKGYILGRLEKLSFPTPVQTLHVSKTAKRYCESIEDDSSRKKVEDILRGNLDVSRLKGIYATTNQTHISRALEIPQSSVSRAINKFLDKEKCNGASHARVAHWFVENGY